MEIIAVIGGLLQSKQSRLLEERCGRKEWYRVDLMDPNALSSLMFLSSTDPGVDNECVCHVCLTPGKLSKEHVPPRSAYNSCSRLWERLVGDDTRPESMRRVKVNGGFKVRTLCRTCNNQRCSAYASAYVRFVRHLVESPKLFGSTGAKRLVSVPADTLLIAKEIATMILVLEPVDYARRYTDLRNFVLNEDALLTPKFKVYAFLVPDAPEAGTITRFHGRVASFAPGYEFLGGEISWFPFGFVYASQIGRGYHLDQLTDVTHWFYTSSEHERNSAVVSLSTRITGVDSIQSSLGRNRVRPQIDYVQRPV